MWLYCYVMLQNFLYQKFREGYILPFVNRCNYIRSGMVVVEISDSAI